MDLAARIKSVKPSITLGLSAKTKSLIAQGIDVINLSAGEPDFDTPEFIKEAATKALRDGFTKYTAASGIDELKEAVVNKLQKENGLLYEPSEILISCGAKHSLYNICQVLFQAQDEVLVLSPYWVSYPEQVRLSEAIPVDVPSKQEDGFQIKTEQLEALITPKTKALIINSPSNPTGIAYDSSMLERLAELAIRNNLYVISDEIYEPFVYDGFRHKSIASISEEVKKKTLLVNGVSKAYAMTGWRIGYAAGPREIIAAMGILQSQSTSNPSSISQIAAVAALEGGKSFTQKMVAEFDRRRVQMVNRLEKLPGISCLLPLGAFYVFPNISALFSKKYKGRLLKTASGVADFLLEEARVAVVPGEPFGGPEHLRLSYAVSMKNIETAIDRIQAAIAVLE